MKNVIFGLISLITLNAAASNVNFCQVDFGFKDHQQAEQNLGINFPGQMDLNACIKSALNTSWPLNVTHATITYEDDNVVTSTQIRRK